ncbi:hypothetical protein DFP72DRAFT_1015650 [Ephemerocybe angulata]|uniref:Uncharacterized protein n=1 Tax=Ephemerocybe angulata TaxID=980116 RepID=A0A8H6HJY9_9AGAR|nr:hypothetical protein DFP72DRAFT_1015650 [Tulosesus angulatus]
MKHSLPCVGPEFHASLSPHQTPAMTARCQSRRFLVVLASALPYRCNGNAYRARFRVFRVRDRVFGWTWRRGVRMAECVGWCAEHLARVSWKCIRGLGAYVGFPISTARLPSLSHPSSSSLYTSCLR